MLTLVIMFFMRWVALGNYGLVALCIGALVVVLLALAGVSPKEVIVARASHTLLGGGIAWVGYRLWPTWEKSFITDVIAQLIDVSRQYVAAVTATRFRTPSPIEEARLDSLRLDMRVMRSNFAASVRRFTAEQQRNANVCVDLSGLLACTHRIMQATMTLETSPTVFLSPMCAQTLQEFSTALDQAFAHHITLLKTPNTVPMPLTPNNIRSAQRAFAACSPEQNDPLDFLQTHTSHLANAVNTLEDLLLRLRNDMLAMQMRTP